MSLELDTNLQSFREMAAELLKSLPNLKKAEQVENGIKMLNLGYLTLKGDAADMMLARGVWDFVARKALARETELIIAI